LCYVAQALLVVHPEDAFNLPLSTEAFLELRNLQGSLWGFSLNPNENDKWNISCSKTGIYIPSAIYKLNFQHIANHFPS
jgi:hypothetical protein